MTNTLPVSALMTSFSISDEDMMVGEVNWGVAVSLLELKEGGTENGAVAVRRGVVGD